MPTIINNVPFHTASWVRFCTGGVEKCASNGLATIRETVHQNRRALLMLGLCWHFCSPFFLSFVLRAHCFCPFSEGVASHRSSSHPRASLRLISIMMPVSPFTLKLLTKQKPSGIIVTFSGPRRLCPLTNSCTHGRARFRALKIHCLQSTCRRSIQFLARVADYSVHYTTVYTIAQWRATLPGKMTR